MLSLHVDSSAMRLKHVKRLCDIGQDLCSNAAMDRWHDLKLPRGAHLNFMPETLLDGLAYNRLVQI